MLTDLEIHYATRGAGCFEQKSRKRRKVANATPISLLPRPAALALSIQTPLGYKRFDAMSSPIRLLSQSD